MGNYMSKLEKEIYYSIDDNCEVRLTLDEIKILKRFFNCRSKEEFERACWRYANIYDDFRSTDMLRILALASEAYKNFALLKEPLELRCPAKQNGKKPRIIPNEFYKKVDVLLKQGMVRTQTQAIEKGKKMFSINQDTSTLAKKVQARNTSRKRFLKEAVQAAAELE